METLRDRVAKCANLRCRPEANGRYLLYNPATDALHMIGSVEKQILDLCDGRTIDEIVDAASPLMEPVPTPTSSPIGIEIIGFLSALEERGIVEYQ